MFVGLVLCAFLLGLTWPILSAAPALPSQILTGDVYSLTPGTGTYSINASLAENLSAQPWAEVVSPEIFSLGTLLGDPVVVRGVDPSAFLRIENATGRLPAGTQGPWALAGSGLASRLGLAAGQELTLVGSSIPRVDIVPLAATYRSATAADDELLVDYGTARFLTGVGPTVYHSIRVATASPDRLVGYLAARGASVQVSGPGNSVASVNSAPLPTDPRIINLLLRYAPGLLPLDYLAEGVREAANSVQVVAWGLQILVLLLVSLGLHGVQARDFAERRATVGVLRALGAPARWIGLRALRELLPLAAVSSLAGAALGLATAVALPAVSPVVAFGHALRVSWDPVAFLVILLALLAVSATSELLLVQGAIRERPSESLRGEPSTEPPPSLEVVLRG